MTLRSSPPHLTAATDLHPLAVRPAVPERRAVAAVWWTGDALTIIDQRRLPEELVDWRLDVRRGRRRRRSRTLAVRGAPAIGIAGAYGLVIGLDEAGTDLAAMRRSACSPDSNGEIGAVRPTAVNLAARSRCDGARRASLHRRAG